MATAMTELLPLKPFIGGQYVDSKSTERITLFSAVDDSTVTSELHSSGAEDVNRAVKAAEEALPAWKAKSAAEKRDILLRFSDLILEHAERLGYLDSIVSGKPALFSRVLEPQGAAESFKFFAGYTDKLNGECLPADGEGFLRMVRYEPLGVCAGINAFNAPLGTFGFKVAPALAAGNVIIIKASERHPLSTLALGELANRAGIPAGVINIITGTAEAGIALSEHPRIRKISFTGSVGVGKQVQIAATKSNLKRVTLELGGKSPFIVFGDADVKAAVEGAAQTSLSLNGQGCVLGMRMYVHESLAEAFVQGLKVAYEMHASTLGGDPHSLTTMSSPVYHHHQRDIVLGFLEKGKQEAELVTGGARYGKQGCYIEPTIFYRPLPGAEITKKEIFGPVVCIDTFTSDEEVVHKANDTEYGLGAYIYTTNIDRALRVSSQIEAGTVCVNNIQVVSPAMPFGGFKSSGVGRENGIHALRHYTEPKSVIVKYSKVE
ncbi:Aldehyde/histidinol dehydrogenase [Aspergillus carlsbadensis]|nr:Aldehyde/histidinol dehydrogenase [Aspergillus carlsbadensis]